jgi:hypothetical protein
VQPVWVSDSIELDTVAPSTATWSWTTPDTKMSTYTWLVFDLWENLTW